MNRRLHRCRLRSRRGVMLLEVLVAAFLLGTVLLVALEVTARSGRTQAEIARRTEMATLAQTKLEEILKEPSLPAGRQETGDFGTLQPEFGWDAAIEATGQPDLVQVIVRVFERDPTGGALPGGRSYTLTCLRRTDTLPAQETATEATP